MNALEAVISGIVQGITEFFPISSSGHLVILHHLFGLKEPKLTFDIFLHLGTLVSTIAFFRNDILNILLRDRKTLVLLILGSIPTFIIGFFFKDAVEALFNMPKIVGWMLVLTGVWLILASLRLKIALPKRRIGVLNSMAVGLAQGISIIPGISRSGATIATGFLLGFDKEESFRFSFLLAIPAVLGASLLKIGKISSSLSGKEALYFIIGGITAMVVGYAAIKTLLNLIRKGKFLIFGIYCISVGALVVAFLR